MFDEKLSELHSYAASVENLTTLEDSFHQMQIRMNQAEASITTKINRSEFAQMDSLMSRLNRYADFQAKTLDELSSHNTKLNTMEQEIENLHKNIESLEIQLKQTESDVAICALKSDVQVLANDLVPLYDMLSKCASFESVASLSTALTSLAEETHGLQLDQERLETLASDMSNELKTKADALDVSQQYVLRSHFDEMMVALGTTVDTKAAAVALGELTEHVEALTTRVNEQATMVTVAVRFVDWYTNRGESYEYNLQVIDKHLNGLSKASQWSREHPRDPYRQDTRFLDTLGGTLRRTENSFLDLSPSAVALGGGTLPTQETIASPS